MKHIRPYSSNLDESFRSSSRPYTLYMISDRADLKRGVFGYNMHPIWVYPILTNAVRDYMERIAEGEEAYVYEIHLECSIATPADLRDFYAPLPPPDLDAHEQKIKEDPKSIWDMLPDGKSIRYSFDAVEVGEGVVILNPGPGIKSMVALSARILDRVANNL